MQKKEWDDMTVASGVLSIPDEILEAAELSNEEEMTIETVPGVILIGKEDPAGIINQPLIDLFQALGIERDEVERIIKGHDEYYGSERAWSAYDSLHDAYEAAGWSDEQIDSILQIQTPDDAWFARRGITGNYHGGGNEVFEEGDILNWILSHSKEERP